MNKQSTFTNASAARIVASTFGVLAAIGGMTHGIGEVRQGNVAPPGLFIPSWTAGPIATHMGGDPAITIVPNMLVTGTLTLVVSLSLLLWSAVFVQRPHGGLIVIALSIALLLVGGGVGSPVVGVLAGVAGTRIGAPLRWSRAHLSATVQRLLAAAWPWVFGVAVLDGVFLFVGALALVYVFGWGDANLYLNSFYGVVIGLLLTLVTAIAHDLQARDRRLVAHG